MTCTGMLYVLLTSGHTGKYVGPITISLFDLKSVTDAAGCSSHYLLNILYLHQAVLNIILVREFYLSALL